MRLIIDTDRRALVPFAFGLTGTTAPDFRQGDTEPLEIVLVRGSGTGGGLEAIDYPAAGWIAKVAIGQLEEKPITGEFRLEFDGDFTDFIPANATAGQVSSYLNSLTSIIGAGGVTVSVVAGTDGTPGASFLVVFNSSGARSQITGDADNLFPRSATVSVEAVTGSPTVRSSQLIRFTRSPAALATTFSALPAASASLTSVYAWDGDRAITRLKFSNVLGGSYLLTWHKHGGGDYTAAVPYNVTAAGLESIISAFDNLSGLVSVSAVGFRTFDISIAHQPQATGVNGFFVDSTAAVKVPGYSGDISLATVEVEEMLAGATSAAATLEVVIENAGSEMTVLQATATVRNDLFEQTPVTPLEFDVPLGKTEAAGLYLSKAGNLVDIASPATARTNLDVYSKSESDALVPAASETVAGKVELATNAEVISGVDTLRAVTPAGDNSTTWLESYDQQDVSSFAWNAGVTGGMTVLQTVNYKNLNHNSSTAAGSAQIGCLNFNQAGRLPTQGIDWSKKIIFSFLLSRSTASPSAGCVFRGFMGKTQAGMAVGDLITHGVGIKIEGAGVVKIMAHNGTTLVTTNTSFTPNGTECFAVKLVSYGNGTVDCFINGSLVGTNTNAPSVSAGTFVYNSGFECQQVASVATTAQWSISNIKQSFGRR